MKEVDEKQGLSLKARASYIIGASLLLTSTRLQLLMLVVRDVAQVRSITLQL